MKYDILYAQLETLKRNLEWYNEHNIDKHRRGTEWVLCTNIYLAVCYLIEWVAEEEGVHLGMRCIQTYISIVKDRDYFRCENMRDLMRFDMALCSFEEAYGNPEKFVAVNTNVMDALLDILYSCLNAFYSAYAMR